MSKLYIIPDWAGVRTAMMSKLYIIPDCGICENGDDVETLYYSGLGRC
jgi:hypothetical protein